MHFGAALNKLTGKQVINIIEIKRPDLNVGELLGHYQCTNKQSNVLCFELKESKPLSGRLNGRYRLRAEGYFGPPLRCITFALISITPLWEAYGNQEVLPARKDAKGVTTNVST